MQKRCRAVKVKVNDMSRDCIPWPMKIRCGGTCGFARSAKRECNYDTCLALRREKSNSRGTVRSYVSSVSTAFISTNTRTK